MFRAKQVISANKMIRNFSDLSRELEHYPQAILITQRTRHPLVLVSAGIFDDLFSMRADYSQLNAGEPE